MMTTVPTKIVLKSTTRMSLNDRFSSIAPTIQNIRANMVTEQQVSAANRRLAQQLANRPGIQNPAANMNMQQSRGGGRPGHMNMNAVNKRSLQQRLGKSNIKNRLSMPVVQQPIIRGRGRGRGRGGSVGPIQSGGGDNQWISNRGIGRGAFSPRGVRGRGNFRARGRGTYNRFDEKFRGGGNQGHGGGRGGRGRGYPDRFTGQNTLTRRGSGVRGNNRGMRRGGRGQDRGRGGRGRGANSNVSIQDLDNQLDEYMARSKSHLDAELDAYMSQANK